MHRQHLVRVSATTAALIGITGALSGCGAKSGDTTAVAQNPPVIIETIRAQSLPQTLSFTGEITPYVQTSLSAATPGLLSVVLVRAGQTIHAGEVVAKLDTSQNVAQVNALKQAQAAVVTAKTSYQNALIGNTSALNQALAAERAAKTSYQNAKMLYADRTASKSQVVAAQNAVAEAKAGVQAAQANLQKAQLQQQSLLSGGGTGQDLISLQTIVSEDEQALQTANDSLTVAKQNESILQQQLAQDEAQFGSLTQTQVQNAYAQYQAALSNFNAWQNGAYAGQNPYTASLNSLSTVYSFDSNGYNTLQTTRQQYNQAVQAVNQSQTQVASTNAALAAAQKNLTDANPPTASNATAQANALVSVAQAGLDQANAQYQATENSLQSAQQLYNDRTQAKAQMNSAAAALNQAIVNAKDAQLQGQSQIKGAAAALNQANVGTSEAAAALSLQIKDDNIISPIAGKVVSVSAQAGETVEPQIPILTVATTSPVIATLNVPESEIGSLPVGTKVNINLPALAQTFAGIVIDIRPQTDPTTNEYQVDVKLATSDPQILSGMQAQGTFTYRNKRKSIYVPAQSVIILSDGGNEVFLIKNNVAYSQFVQIGAMTANQYQITSGLKPGDQLVISGQNYLTSGQTVQIEPVAHKGATSK